MVLPEVPGIIEGSMTVSPEPDGRVSLRVLTGGSSAGAGRDLIELIISLEDLGRALADTKSIDRLSALPCHVGFCPDAGRQLVHCP
jgi:hypothetical protein